ncbi:AlpA family transcriptional regulator [Microbulbifer sp. 2205BS26-8]|uniref:helix-turn-helix transcriptional regulator n=1 Tax=Microbulbifer sp. 2205BS26-8 TaxID=3064386 RepID=UPI00273EAB26|nr:AlpA family transcriptional regulator [Microbulbifer sp. 2205BS26-8]MDP5210025.1 AlpA family transcriptional regulator [Microbulbifer sp. 2205BS26-8]
MDYCKPKGESMKTPRRILRLPEVERLTGYKRSSIYRMAKEGQFPQQKRIGPRAVGWDSQEVETWIEDKLDGAA